MRMIPGERAIRPERRNGRNYKTNRFSIRRSPPPPGLTSYGDRAEVV
jgi:hypothetical protein